MLGGCAIVQSTPESVGAPRVGLAYMLPKALLPVELVQTAAGQLQLRVLTPQLVGDPAQRYFVYAPANAFSTDTTKIEVDAATGLLRQVTATSKDESLSALTELASALRARRKAERDADGEQLLFSALFDPDGMPQSDAAARNSAMLVRMQKILVARLQQWQAECSTDKTDVQKCNSASSLLAAIAAAPPQSADAGKTPALVAMSATPLLAAGGTNAAAPGSTQAAAPQADCSVGICHRMLQPFQIDLAIAGLFAQSTVVQLPNGGAPIALPLDRAPFVSTVHTVMLTNGQVASHEVTRPSSALALVKWPLDAYRAVLEATATLVQLRIGDNTKQVELAQSQLTTATELKRIREELEALKPKVERSPGAAGSAASDALVVAVLAQRQGVAAPPIPTVQDPGQGGLPAPPGLPSPPARPAVSAPSR